MFYAFMSGVLVPACELEGTARLLVESKNQELASRAIAVTEPAAR